MKPLYPNYSKRFIKILSPILTLGLGCLVIIFAFLSQHAEEIVQICQVFYTFFYIFVIVLKSVNGIVGGPTVGIFTLGLFFPWVSQVPAVIGLILGLACAIWVFICSKV